jgi:drug/metabolite transporter (DMT)-like permease
MVAFSLALGASAAWGGADFLAGLKSRSLPVLSVIAVSQVTGLVVVAALAISLGVGLPEGETLFWGMVSGAFGVASLAAFYRGLAVGSMAVVAPIAATDALVPVAGGAAIGEGLSGLEGLGAALALGGVVLVSRPSKGEGQDGGALSSGAGFGLLAALGFGCFTMALDQASEGGVLAALLVNRVTSVALLSGALMLYAPSAGPTRSDAKLLVAVGLLDLAATGLLAAASTQGLISQVGLLGSLYPVVTVILARLVLRERLGALQGAGAGGALAGAAVLAAA